tara:strand:+ start:3256 stop:3606 length:351 start_codon:yes stop_codon:yes gene_type:complete
MKHILLTLMVLGSFGVCANMDNQCVVELQPLPGDVTSSGGGDRAVIEYAIKKNQCKRNNILLVMVNRNLREKVTDIDVKNSFTLIASDFCRFDRNVLMSDSFLSCVLYDTKGRETL